MDKTPRRELPRNCKKCGVLFQAKRCEICHRAGSKEYALRNQEAVRQQRREYREANKEALRERKRVYREENKEKVRAAKARYSEQNSSAIVAKVSAWRKENPAAHRIQSHNYRAKRRASGGKLSPGLADKLFDLQRGKCACCGLPLGKNFHMDHIQPIALGGPNVDSNIQLLRQRCNNQKSAKDPIDFMQQRGKLL